MDLSQVSAGVAGFVRAGGGVVHDDLELVRLCGDGQDRGCFARRAIKSGAILVRLPLASCYLSASNALDLSLSLSDALSSRCDPYLVSLPTCVESLADWSDDEKDRLKGTSLWGSWRDEDAAVAALNDRRHFRQALRLVRTRAFELHGSFCLVPGIDALNHKNKGASARLFIGDDDVLELVAVRDIEAGQEVTHVYDDDLTSAEALSRYGILDNTFSSSSVFVDLQNLTVDPERLDACRALLQGNTTVALSLEKPLPEALLEVMTLLALSEIDFHETKNVVDTEVNGNWQSLDLLETLDKNAPLRHTVDDSLRALAHRKITAFFDNKEKKQPHHQTANTTLQDRHQRRIKAALALRDSQRAVWAALRHRLGEGGKKQQKRRRKNI